MNKLYRLEFSDCLKCISIGRERREYFCKLNVNITSKYRIMVKNNVP